MCANGFSILLSLGLGFGLGWAFALVIGKTGLVELQYFNGIKNQEVCKKVSKQKFKCSTKNVM